MSAAIGSCAAEARLAVCMTRWSRPAGPSKPRPEAGPSGTGLASGSQSATPLTRPCVGKVEGVSGWSRPTLVVKATGCGSYQRTAPRGVWLPALLPTRSRRIHGFARAISCGPTWRREEGRHPCRARGGPCQRASSTSPPGMAWSKATDTGIAAGPAWRRLRPTPGSPLPATRTKKAEPPLKKRQGIDFQPWKPLSVTSPPGEQSCSVRPRMTAAAAPIDADPTWAT